MPVRFLRDRHQELLDDARARLAGFVGAQAEDLVFVPNATAGVNAVLRSFPLAAGDQLRLSPKGRALRVRGLRAQNQESETGLAGERVALNIAGPEVDREAVTRGEWVLAADVDAPTRRLDARIRILPSERRPFRHWTPVHVHMAASDVTGRVAHAIMDLCNEPDARTHPDDMRIKVSRQELSRLVGCSREMAGRVLKVLEEQGLVTASGKTIVVYGARPNRNI